MLLRQEAALDRSIDRKVRILLALRKELAMRPMAPPGEDDGERKESMEEVGGSDIMSHTLQGVEVVENSKMKERYANVTENKGSDFSSPGGSGNVIENTGSYTHSSGMLLKGKGVIRNAESHATGKRSSTLPASKELIQAVATVGA